MSEQDSCYSNDQQYFLDLCRGNEISQLQQFIKQMPINSEFNWSWCNYSSDNFMHMIAANNLTELFDYIMPVLVARCSGQQILEILNKQNSSNCTPLHYAVVTNSKDMALKLIQAGANTLIKNDMGRTPLQEAEKFEKFQVAEVLALHTKTDIEALRKEVGDVKLNQNDDSDEEEEPEHMEEIQEKEEKEEKQEESVNKVEKKEEIIEKIEKLQIEKKEKENQ